MLLAPVLPDPEPDATDTPLTSVRTSALPWVVIAPDVPEPSPRSPPGSETEIDTPGRKPASVAAFLPDGSALMISASSTCWRAVFWTSTTGDSPVTVIV